MKHNLKVGDHIDATRIDQTVRPKRVFGPIEEIGILGVRVITNKNDPEMRGDFYLRFSEWNISPLRFLNKTS